VTDWEYNVVRSEINKINEAAVKRHMGVKTRSEVLIPSAEFIKSFLNRRNKTEIEKI